VERTFRDIGKLWVVSYAYGRFENNTPRLAARFPRRKTVLLLSTWCNAEITCGLGGKCNCGAVGWRCREAETGTGGLGEGSHGRGRR
jgi:hypothetical protein